jgi:hypothetical protein
MPSWFRRSPVSGACLSSLPARRQLPDNSIGPHPAPERRLISPASCSSSAPACRCCIFRLRVPGRQQRLCSARKSISTRRISAPWPDLADVPSLEELGIRDAVSDTFQGIYAPAGTPPPIIDRLVTELTAILGRDDVREKFTRAGLPVVAEGPDAFRARIAREVPMYKEIIDQAGLKIQ